MPGSRPLPDVVPWLRECCKLLRAFKRRLAQRGELSLRDNAARIRGGSNEKKYHRAQAFHTVQYCSDLAVFVLWELCRTKLAILGVYADFDTASLTLA
jgi:hypothetical protein